MRRLKLSLPASGGVVILAFLAVAGVGSILTSQTVPNVVASALAIATPLVLAALGGLISERAGVVNIALEGMMIVGALAGFLTSVATGSWVIALIAAALAGAALGLLHAVVSIFLRADQIISGTAINLIALFGTAYVFRSVFGLGAELPTPARIPSIAVLGQQINLLTIAAIVLVVVIAYSLYRTPLGLWLLATGENTRAAQTVAINVVALRVWAVVASGALGALGGAFLSIGILGSFSENMSGGRGFVALAALIVGRWHPVGLVAACLLFALAGAFGNGLQVNAGVSADLTAALPYALTLAALLLTRGSAAAPAALGKPLDLRK